MPEIEGIMFDEHSHALVSELIKRLKQHGVCDVYPLPSMNAGRGEVRLAHVRSDTKRKKAKGVFGGFIPTAKSVSLAYCKIAGSKNGRIPITSENLDLIFDRIVAQREFVKERRRGSEKVHPQPGMVSGGQFESDRSRH